VSMGGAPRGTASINYNNLALERVKEVRVG